MGEPAGEAEAEAGGVLGGLAHIPLVTREAVEPRGQRRGAICNMPFYHSPN